MLDYADNSAPVVSVEIVQKAVDFSAVNDALLYAVVIAEQVRYGDFEEVAYLFERGAVGRALTGFPLGQSALRYICKRDDIGLRIPERASIFVKGI